MVHSVEPGLYDPNVGGVRIEDMVLNTKDGAERLSKYCLRD
jgi:Xaa-Pro dipeptidase